MRATRDYLIRMRRDTILRAACEAVDCDSWRYGWLTFADERTDLGLARATYIRQGSGRDFTESKDGPLTVFRFSPGQRCFTEHSTRGARLLVREGHQLVRQHVRLGDWIEDLDEHVTNVADQLKKG